MKREKIGIYRCDTLKVSKVFRTALVGDNELYKELTKYPCLTFEDV